MWPAPEPETLSGRQPPGAGALLLHSGWPQPHEPRPSLALLPFASALRQCSLQNSSPEGTLQLHPWCLHSGLLSR
jgi:hypothetical protein